MSRLVSVVILLAGVPAFAQVQAPAPTASGESLRDYVLKNQHREACGLYFFNHKVGWLTSDCRLGKENGRDVAVQTTEMYFAINLGRGRTVKKEKEVTDFSLEGKGEVVGVEVHTTEDNNNTILTGTRDGDHLTLTTRTRDHTTQRQVPIPRETLRLQRDMDRWLESSPAKGATFDTYSSDWNEEDIDQKMTFVMQGSQTILWGGVPTRVHQVRIRLNNTTIDAEVQSDGTFIKGKLGGILEVRREEESVAKKLDTGKIDMLAASSVHVDRDLGEARQVRALKLDVGGAGDFAFPQSHRQAVHPENGKVVLDLHQDFPVDKPAPLAEEARRQYTSPTPSVQCDQEAIRSLARKIVGSETAPLQQARLLEKWVYQNLRKTYSADYSTALDVLDHKAGACKQHTLLFVALARAIGLPARAVGGLAYTNYGQPLFGWHAWAEIHDGRQWVTIDPTWNEVYIDATHIKMAEKWEDMGWVNVAGSLKMKVLRVESGK